MMTLYEEARIRNARRPDWKADVASAYRRYVDAVSQDEKQECMSDIALAYAPLCFYISWRFVRDGSMSREEAFSIGMEAVAPAVRSFDPTRHSGGVDGICNHIAQHSNWNLIHVLQKDVRRAGLLDVCSLDGFDVDSFEHLAYEEQVDVSERSVSEIVRDVIASLPPSDQVIAEHRLYDAMGWKEMREAMHAPTTYEALRGRWTHHIRPKLEAALRRAGYGEEDL